MYFLTSHGVSPLPAGNGNPNWRKMQIIELPETDSTNSYLDRIAPGSDHGTVVVAYSQTAGRGQRGNSWESAPGKNITMSLLLRPANIVASNQFIISQAVSVAIVKVLRRHLSSGRVSVKWPNDIYVDDRKICGILIENTLSGKSIDYSIIGMGINVNQQEFLSDAPNPVSMYQLTRLEYDIKKLVREFTDEILLTFAGVDEVSAGQCEIPESHLDITKEYASMQWRNDGYYPYHDNIRDVDMMGAIESVAPTGHITLVTLEGDKFTYAFKEVIALLKF